MAENTLNRIKQYLDFKRIKVSAFEREIGMSNGSFASQLKHNKTIGVDKLENIVSKYPDLNPDWLLKGSGNMLNFDLLSENPELYQKTERANLDIPVYDIKTTTEIIDLLSDNKEQLPVSYIRIPKIAQCDGALYVTGDSMYPLIKSGDIVVYQKINNLENNIIWGEMYLIYVHNDDNEFFLTRFLKQSERKSYVQFVSQNPDQQTVEFPISSIKLLALIKASVRINTLF